MRKAMISALNDVYTDYELSSEETKRCLKNVESYVKDLTGKEEDENEEFCSMMTCLMWYIFMDAANMVFDFISGKEIEELAKRKSPL